ncbi:carbon-nitrogen family hydrolase [Aquibacillus halophilus]|uniref:Carbon-nitrogen family hydrolase n=1 Tax=Aquibacillus halophilus TaxID=930132 RepID=A0A6A8DEP8_9BACI|nr:carbon-nitrogen family hydrolase [Aquibacillus halophilus]MRH43710.1 carbon-nitrogen family hydrolase [Aquibacillus halophilus]
MKIALMQMDISYGNPKLNQDRIVQHFKNITKDKVDLVVLPELWTTGYDLTRLDEIADEDGTESIQFISNLAKKYHVNIIAGSIAKKTGNQITNTMIVINRKGELIKEYSKAHLFRLMNEEKHLVEGDDDGIFQLENHRSAGVICYDIRFPEWIRTHMLNDTKLLFVVAEWPKPRIDHWKALLISRAIENQCFVIGCNRVGSDPNNEFGGNSMIIGPWGEMISEAQDTETILYGEIDVEQVDKVRNTIPIFSDRRPDLYKL